MTDAATNDSTQALARKLQRIVRYHGFPCRVTADGQLRVASPSKAEGQPGFGWAVETLPVESAAVMQWLGY